MVRLAPTAPGEVAEMDRHARHADQPDHQQAPGELRPARRAGPQPLRPQQLVLDNFPAAVCRTRCTQPATDARVPGVQPGARAALGPARRLLKGTRHGTSALSSPNQFGTQTPPKLWYP